MVLRVKIFKWSKVRHSHGFIVIYITGIFLTITPCHAAFTITSISNSNLEV